MWWTEVDGRVFAKKLGLGCKGREGSQLLYVHSYFLKDARNNLPQSTKLRKGDTGGLVLTAPPRRRQRWLLLPSL